MNLAVGDQAVSGDQRTKLGEALDGAEPVERTSLPVFQLELDACELCRRDMAKVFAFGEVLAQ